MGHGQRREGRGRYEAIYNNMPPFGLGKAGRLVPLTEHRGARERLSPAGV
jgi:hypothetical protein